MKPGSKVLAIVLLFVGLVLINFLASQLPLRGDATAENIYTLSPGTKSLLGKIEEPLTLELYFSKDASGLPVAYKNYAARVEEMLRQYVRAGRGKLTLNVINPKPDTPEEERATAAGLQPQVTQGGLEQVYFGLVATQADQQKTLTAFNPQRESFLEYDLSQLIYSVQQFDRRKLGLLSGVPLQAPPFNPMMMQMRQQPPPSQFVINEWERTFEILPVEAGATELPADLDALAVVHPQNLSPKLQYAIDQFLLSGKPVFLALDPSSQYFKRQGGQMAMMGGPQPNVSSDLPALLNAYGITYNPQNVVGDLENATQVSTGGGNIARFPVWLSLRKEDFSSAAMPTAQLESMILIEPGSFTINSASGLTVTPLLESSAQSGDVPAATLQFAQPDDVARQITPTGKKTLAALLTGKFKTAFPDGPPKEAPPEGAANATEPKPATEPTTPAAATSPALKESTTASTLVVIADTDWLFDDYSVRKMNFFGQQAAEPLNDNLAFASNTLEFLAGSQDLISIRGKGNSLRPFTVVRQMEVDAQKQYQTQLTALEARLTDVQTKLTEIQGKRTDGNRLVATPEMQKAIEDFQKQQADMRRERREIRRALREDIDALENRLLLVNLLATPALVGLFGLWFARARRR